MSEAERQPMSSLVARSGTRSGTGSRALGPPGTSWDLLGAPWQAQQGRPSWCDAVTMDLFGSLLHPRRRGGFQGASRLDPSTLCPCPCPGSSTAQGAAAAFAAIFKDSPEERRDKLHSQALALPGLPNRPSNHPSEASLLSFSLPCIIPTPPISPTRPCGHASSVPTSTSTVDQKGV